MQKIIYIDDKYTSEVNEELSKGWKIISVSPVSTHTGEGYTYHFGAYVVLEKNKNINEDNTVVNNMYYGIDHTTAVKEFYDPEVIV